MKIFVDNCLSPVLAETLGGYLSHRDERAVHIRDAPCGRHATDLEWIAFLFATGDDWLVVTGDLRLQRNKAERKAYRQTRLRGLVLAPAFQKIPVHQQASVVLWRWKDIEALMTLAPPFLMELPITRHGGIRVLPI